LKDFGDVERNYCISFNTCAKPEAMKTMVYVNPLESLISICSSSQLNLSLWLNNYKLYHIMP